jgi:PAS domain S-box-containing protein
MSGFMKTNLVQSVANRRLLLVDDNSAIHEDFKKILGGGAEAPELDALEASIFGADAGKSDARRFEIDSAFQGQEALTLVEKALAEGRPYAMAFIDVRMPPGWDGIETIGRIWAVYPDLQVVLCTAYSDYSWDEMIAKVGQSDRLVILKKPFDNIEVLQLANALAEKWHLLQESKIRMETLEKMVEARAAELVKAEERFRLIAENSADLISVLDPDGGRLYTSPSFAKVLGLSAEELRATPTCAQYHPDDQITVWIAMRAAVELGTGQVLEYRMQHRDHSWRVLESQINPVRNARGEVEHLVVVARDITERKRTEEERRLIEIQLRHGQKMESIGQLAAGIAHEINTPTQYIGDNIHFVQDGFRDLQLLLLAQARLLAAVKEGTDTASLVAEVEVAAKAADVEYLEEEIPKAIEQSLQGVKRVAKIVGAMKEFSHPGTNEKTAIDLNRAIESTVTVATNEWKYVADVVMDLDPALPAVPCLPGEFNQVILNIVVNASHAIGDMISETGKGKSKGTITLSTRLDGDWAEIRIRDTGAGMSEDIQAKIFDPFFTTKGVGRGTGQGLAIAHSVMVDKHGGCIRVESEPGKGSTFILRLPATAAQPERMAA